MKKRAIFKCFTKFLFVINVLLFTSCATLFNKPTSRIAVHTKSPATIVINNDTIETVENTASFIVNRSGKNLEIISFADSLTKTYTVSPMLSPMFYNNFSDSFVFTDSYRCVSNLNENCFVKKLTCNFNFTILPRQHRLVCCTGCFYISIQ